MTMYKTRANYISKQFFCLLNEKTYSTKRETKLNTFIQQNVSNVQMRLIVRSTGSVRNKHPAAW